MSDNHNERRYTIINGKRYIEFEGELIEVVESIEELMREERRRNGMLFDDPIVDGFFKLWIGITAVGALIAVPLLMIGFRSLGH